MIIKKIRNRWDMWNISRGPSIAESPAFFGCHLIVRPHENVGRDIVLGSFEASDLQFFIDSIHANDVVFDIGANLGAYSVPIGKLHPTAQIFAFEPIPLNAALVRASLVLNEVTNVDLVQKCVADVDGTVEFSLSEDSAYSSMVDTGRRRQVARLRVDATSIDTFLSSNKIQHIDVMKIDVEGAELRVLEGANSIFDGSRPAPRLVLIELFDENLSVFDTNIDNVLAKMKGWGYNPFVLVNGQELPFMPEHHNNIYNVFFKKYRNINYKGAITLRDQ